MVHDSASDVQDARAASDTVSARTCALFAIVVLGCSFGNLSQTAVNAMMGGICADFGITEAVAQWLTTIYMLVLGITVPAVTFLSRKLPLRTLVLIALGLFAVGSLVSLIAWDFPSLLAGRVLQAISSGITLPLIQTIAMTRFPKRLNATAMGVSGIAMGFAPNIGPSVGGALVDSFGWHSFFVILVLSTVVLIVATVFVFERDAAPGGATWLDVPSLMMSTLGFGGLLLAFSNASNYSVLSPFVWAPFAVGTVCVAVFVVRQRRIDQPLVNMRIFESRRFGIGFVCLNLLFGSFMGITLIVPLYVSHVCGGTAFEAGLIFIPATIGALFSNPLAGILTDRVGVRPVVTAGCLMLAVGSASMAFIDGSTPYAVVAALQLVRATGVSTLIGPFSAWSLSELRGPRVMDGSAFSVTVRQACASLGTAIMVLVITVVSATSSDPALPYQLAFGFSALLAVATAVLGIWKVR